VSSKYRATENGRSGKKPEVDIGPLISKDAIEKVEQQVKQAVSEGAKILWRRQTSAAGESPATFLNQTVLTNVRHGASARTKRFLANPFADRSEGCRCKRSEKANDSCYGLGANIYTRSLEYAMRAMEDIKAGTFWVNDPLTDNDAGPFGGMRFSAWAASWAKRDWMLSGNQSMSTSIT